MSGQQLMFHVDHLPARSVVAIDPGNLESGMVAYDGGRVLAYGILDNEALLERLVHFAGDELACAIEYTPPYVMRMKPTASDPKGNPYVPRQVFDTAKYIGRLEQVWYQHAGEVPVLVPRNTVKKHTTGKASRVGDSEVRAALIEKFGGKERAIGNKASPGPLYGITSHCWAALAVAVTYYETTHPEPAF